MFRSSGRSGDPQPETAFGSSRIGALLGGCDPPVSAVALAEGETDPTALAALAAARLRAAPEQQCDRQGARDGSGPVGSSRQRPRLVQRDDWALGIGGQRRSRTAVGSRQPSGCVLLWRGIRDGRDRRVDPAGPSRHIVPIACYRAGSNSSIGLPSGSSTWICRPTGPASI